MSVKSTCAYCGVGCGVVVEPGPDSAGVAGDPDHPANQGRLCSKGTQLGETLNTADRPTDPLVDGEGVDWDTALDHVAHTFKETIARHGPDSVAIYASGQLLTEDYYVANKLMKGAIGSANIDTNSRLCMASAVAAHKRAFGSDTVPCGYADLERAELVVLVGSNLAWCHPVVHQRIRAMRADGGGPVIVVIDPRETATTTGAELHLPIRPGTDGVLFNGLLHWLDEHNLTDTDYIDAHIEGYAESLLAARASGSVEDTAAACGLSPIELVRFYKLFAKSPRTVTVFSQGINQSHVGTDKASAIINVHLATGRIGKPGAGPFSITGQPNAMGGREVGGLANQLAAHMDFSAEHVDRVQRFWGFQRIADRPGLAAVDMFDAIADGRIKAIWIMATNPAVSLPKSDRVNAALAGCEFVVVSDCVRSTDTTRHANVLLPAKGWGEKDGTVTNSERCISRQRRFLNDSHGARADWEMISDVARRMGFEAQFNYESAADIFREHAALSAFENDGGRDFDIGALRELSNADYDALPPTYWPCPDNGPVTTEPHGIFADNRFFTPSGRARMVPVRSFGVARDVCIDYPLLLTSGRLRDQWHTMTRTERATKLNRHRPWPTVTVHPLDARQYGLKADEIVRLTSREGTADLLVHCSTSVQPGGLFVPMHWSDQWASAARIDALFSGTTDPLSQQPELKSEPVALSALDVHMHVLWLRRATTEVSRPNCAFWASTRFDHCAVDLLGFTELSDREGLLATLLNDQAIHLRRERDGRTIMAASVVNDALETLVLISDRPIATQVGWYAALFEEQTLSTETKATLLRGSPGYEKAFEAPGPTLCACHGTSVDSVAAAVASGRAINAEAVGDLTRAGTRCGSCIPEIEHMIEKG
ncbi:MAG: molybdopterin-dependent oxidoreductase [Pseudomonadota bacterium]